MAALHGLSLQVRCICTSTTCFGKRNFRKFMLYGKRGSKIFKEQQTKNPDPDLPSTSRGARDIGYMNEDRFVTVPEMIPQLIVPDLTDCKLKPYVTYKAPEVVQSEFTAEDLFNAVYSKKIVEDFKNGKLDPDGNSLEPSPEEALDPESAKVLARKTGSDLFGP